MGRALLLGATTVLLCAALPSADVDAMFEEATDAHRRAQKHKVVDAYEAAIDGYTSLLEAPTLDEERRHKVAFYRAEAAWDLGRWRLAYDSYQLCMVPGHKWAFDAGFNRVFAAEKIRKQATVTIETNEAGERVLVRRRGRMGRQPPRPPFTAERLALDEPLKLMRQAALDLRALLIASGPDVPAHGLHDGATVELAMAKLMAEHGHLLEAQEHLDLAREQWRGYESAYRREQRRHPRSAPDFDKIQVALDAVLAGAEQTGARIR
jgi:hypothetical protein